MQESYGRIYNMQDDVPILKPKSENIDSINLPIMNMNIHCRNL